MKIALDLDDVVFDFWKGVCASVNLEYGLDIDPDDTPTWDDNALKKLTCFGPGRTWWDWLEERDWIWATFKPVPGALGAIERLRQQGHFVEALTSKPHWAEWTVWKLLGRWRPAFNRVTIVPTGESKPDRSDSELLIDDRDKNLLDWIGSWRQAICFQRPWSNVDALPDSIPTARTWAEVLDLVDEYHKTGGFIACR